MRSITYVGPFDIVELEVAPGIWANVEHGGSIEVTDQMAASLLEQIDNWSDPNVAPEPVPVPDAEPEPEPKPKRTRRKPVTDDAVDGDKE